MGAGPPDAPKPGFGTQMKTPRTDSQANTYEVVTTPLLKATGFREDEARPWSGGPQ